MRSVLLAVRMPMAAGCSGINPDLQLVLAWCWLHPDRASDTLRGTCCLARAHMGLCHATPCCAMTLCHTVLCHADLDVGVQQPQAMMQRSLQPLGLQSLLQFPGPSRETHILLLQGWRMRGSGTVLTLPSHHRGLPETGEVSTGLHALLAPGVPTLCQRLQLPRWAQVLPLGVPAALHPPGRRYGTAVQPLTPPLSRGSWHPSPCPIPCAIPIAVAQLPARC